MLEIEVTPYGTFKEVFPESKIALTLKPGSTIADLRSSLKSVLHEINPTLEPILNASVLANDERIFVESDPLADSSSISLLPPVCGG